MAQPVKAQVSMTLVVELEKLFPDKLSTIQLSDSERELWIARGAVNVVGFLRRQAELQNKDPS